MQPLFDKLKAFNELVMLKHSIFSLPFIFIAMIVASRLDSGSGWFGFKLLVLGVLAAVSARNFAMAVNRLADADIDAKNPRTTDRPSVDGRIDVQSQYIFIVINALIFIVTAYMINDLSFYLSFLFLPLLALYSYFKRFSSLAHLFLGLTLGLAPIAGVIAVSESVPLWSLLLASGVIFWVAGFDLLYSLQDMEFDREEGLYSIPSIYGEQATLFISALFHGLSTLFWFYFAIASESGFFTYLAIALSGIILYKEQLIVRKDFKKIDRAFFTLNGYLGIMFLIFVIVDTL
jgi:4-hydroxybenzoate polyprenyltransferase